MLILQWIAEEIKKAEGRTSDDKTADPKKEKKVIKVKEK